MRLEYDKGKWVGSRPTGNYGSFTDYVSMPFLLGWGWRHENPREDSAKICVYYSVVYDRRNGKECFTPLYVICYWVMYQTIFATQQWSRITNSDVIAGVI
jgi:hypothetical protein